MVEFSQVLKAREDIDGAVYSTPVFTSDALGEQLGIKLVLKAELLQKTGSFKPRGVLNRLRNTPRAELERGVITVSAGNHGQALAWGAREVGVSCTVVMSQSASPSKVAATRRYGAEVIQIGTIKDAFDKMDQLRKERNLLLVHAFDDPLIIAGQGTIGLEILDQAPEVNVIVCPIGGGGLISGIALAAKTLKPSVRVFGVEPVGASAMRQSWDRGEVVHLDSVNTIADGLAPPMAGQITYPMTRRYVDDILTLTDAEIGLGIRALVSHAKLAPEPAGAAATAALLAGKVPARPGESVVAVVSGGNVDLERLRSILSEPQDS